MMRELHEKQKSDSRSKLQKATVGWNGVRGKITLYVTMIMIMTFFVGCASANGMNMESADAGFYMNSMDLMSTTQAATKAYSSKTEADGWNGSDYEFAADSSTASNSASGENAQLNDSARKLIRDANLTLETLQYEECLNRIEQEIDRLGGYIEKYSNSDKSYYDQGYQRYANLTARIPQQHLDTFLNTVGEIGNVVNESQSAKDVTMTYVDIESRKKALEIEQERLLALLEKADNIESIIALEERLSDVRYQLESYASQLRTYDNLVDYSTVTMSIQEVREVTKEEPQTLLERMGRGFSDTIDEITQGAQDFAVWFVTNAIYLVFWAIILIVICVVVVKFFKKMLRKLDKMFKASLDAAPAQKSGLPEEKEHKE